MQWLRRSFLTGFVVAVPLIISVAAFVWLFQLIDGVMVPVYARWLGREVPGIGLLTLAVLVLCVGVVSTNVLGGRLLQRGETVLLRLPVFRAVYGPVKQLVEAFSPHNTMGFKKVVLVDDPRRGLVLGFQTKRFDLDRGEWAGGAGRCLRADQPHLFRRHPHLLEPGCVLPGAERAGRGPGLSDRRHGPVADGIPERRAASRTDGRERPHSTRWSMRR